jgi:23S rRNA (guanosine2251-2'-O)-methyltransferase
VSAFPVLGLAELAARLPREEAALLVALDQVQDPGNAGAIIRSAAAAGAHGVIIGRDRSAPPGGAMMRSSAGAAARIPVATAANLARTLDFLKDEGLWIYGADRDGKSVWEIDLSGPACIVMGGEHRGLRPLVRERCDFIVSVPMAAGVESLNVSAAAAVILFEATRQRGLAKKTSRG